MLSPDCGFSENLSEETDDFVTNSIDNQRARQHNTSLHYADYVSSINTSEISDLNVHLKEQCYGLDLGGIVASLG
ncbi:hypothetical protein C2G38_2156497 [Gigaspora rosea]|uniref:Uncharacterized protein n=1 Tax=Gigaspora rosea TaxID=44941 RepID=A0A397W616_9GLOM|nr:hypothetical protein C2G38_2156497 [Gigaspora rosea]